MCSFLYSNVLCKSNSVQCCVRLYCAIAEASVNSPNLPLQEASQKLLKVAIIGMPNAGKSTFINNLMDKKVCPASSKVHTTRNKAMAVFTEGESQIIFLDTPGIVNLEERNRFNLERSFITHGKTCSSEADVIGVIHDASNKWTRDKLDIKVIKLLEKHKEKTSFLVFNKVDLLKSKRKLLDLTRQVTDNCIDGKPIPGTKPLKNYGDTTIGWPYFSNIFMVSSLTGNGLDGVRNYLIDSAQPAKWMFPSNVWTDQSAEEIIINTVQAKLLDFLPQEIPYELKTCIEYFAMNENGVIKTVILVKSPTVRKAKLVAGNGEGRLRQITEHVQRDLQELFQNYVRIKIVVEGPKE